MEEFFASHPNDAYVCSKLGALYMQMGKIDAGMELLNRGLNQLIGNQVNEEKKTLNKFKHSQSQKVEVAFNEDINYDILYELHYHH